MKKLLPLILLSLPLSAWACNNGAVFEQHPLVANGMNKDFFVLCNSKNTVGYSGITKTGVWSAAFLNRDSVKKSTSQDRQDNFHEESRVPPKMRAWLKDYRKSGYDRGHLYPNADAPDRQSQYESFSLSNMVPQVPSHNQRLWAKLEQRTRTLASRHNGAYVVTGGAWVGSSLKAIGQNKVLVPTQLWKAVYLPSENKAGAFLSDNSEEQSGRYISLNDLHRQTGVNAFPALKGAVRNQIMEW